MRQKDIDAITEVLANEIRFAQVGELPGLRMAAGALSKAFLKGNGVLDTTVLVALAESTTRERLEDSHEFDSSDGLYCDLCELPERNNIHRTTE